MASRSREVAVRPDSTQFRLLLPWFWWRLKIFNSAHAASFVVTASRVSDSVEVDEVRSSAGRAASRFTRVTATSPYYVGPHPCSCDALVQHSFAAWKALRASAGQLLAIADDIRVLPRPLALPGSVQLSYALVYGRRNLFGLRIARS